MDIYAIGDIHGCSRQLSILLAEIPVCPEDWVVFLGDYVDIGDWSKAVIDVLIAWKTQHPRSVFLIGNHELALSHYIRDGNLVEYAKFSGVKTIRSYLPEPPPNVYHAFVDAIPDDHRDFYSSLNLYWDRSNVLFSHAGLDPRNPADRGLANLVLKSHLNIFGEYKSWHGFVVCGHYFSSTGRIRVTENAMCVDTGCGIAQGPLSAIQLRGRKAYKVKPNGGVSIDAFVFPPRAVEIIARLLRMDPNELAPSRDIEQPRPFLVNWPTRAPGSECEGA